MTSSDKTQTRGICQCCGRDQAVLDSGRMSKHGYTVEQGWFSGVCGGQRFEPLQVSRKEADRVAALVLVQVAELRQLALDLASGAVVPTTAQGNYVRMANGKWGYESIAWADACEHTRIKDIRRRIAEAGNRADLGERFSADLTKLANEVHGTALRIVVLEAGPAPILDGEKRLSANGSVLVARYTEGGRVQWKSDRNGKTFQSWTGVAAWRRLPLATEGA